MSERSMITFELKKYRKFIFPIFILILIVSTYFVDRNYILPVRSTIVPLLVGGIFVTWNTVKAIIKLRKITAGSMVVLALIGTFYAGEYIAGAIVAFMMIFGELLEDVTLERTRNAVRELIKLVPAKVWKKIDGEFVQVPLKQVRVKDVLLAKPGEQIPVDGCIIKGQACLNEAAITGESMPVDKTIGDKVFVGTFNENGVIEIITEKIGSKTTLGKIIKVVKQAQENKGRIQKLADRFAAYFTPAIIIICLVVWILTFDHFRVTTILVVACPCALVLATPTAVVASVGNSARRGGLIKGGISLENTGKVTTVCFDKTGTITEGKPELVDITPFGDWTRRDILNYSAIAEKHSQHPIGKTILEFAGREGIRDIPDGTNFQMLFGRGVTIDYKNESLEVSNHKVLEDRDLLPEHEAEAYLSAQEEKGRTSLLVLKGNRIIGGIAIADKIRPDVPETIRGIKAIGIKRFIILTGDNEKTAHTIAAQANVDEYQANLSPEDKLNFIKNLQNSGEVVAMVGDGVNDAPALAVAEVGIAMGVIGTDVAVETADIALMSDNIAILPEIFGISRMTLKTIKQNIWVFAVSINIVGIVLSGLGFFTPIAAALLHNMSSVMVVSNSARLLTYKSQKSGIKRKQIEVYQGI